MRHRGFLTARLQGEESSESTHSSRRHTINRLTILVNLSPPLSMPNSSLVPLLPHRCDLCVVEGVQAVGRALAGVQLTQRFVSVRRNRTGSGRGGLRESTEPGRNRETNRRERGIKTGTESEQHSPIQTLRLVYNPDIFYRGMSGPTPKETGREALRGAEVETLDHLRSPPVRSAGEVAQSST